MFSDFFVKSKLNKICLSEHKQHQDRNIYDVFNKVFVFRKSFSAICAFVFAFAVTGSHAAPQYFNVEIVDGANSYELVSTGTTVEQLLSAGGLELSESDKVTPSLESYITSSQTVRVQRLKNVTVNISGRVEHYLTSAETVGEFLEQQNIDINYHDTVNLPLESELESEAYIEITKVIRRIAKVETEIPFETRTVRDTSMDISESKIVTEGVNGTRCETYEVVIENGVEVSRELVSDEITKQPVAQVKAVGAHASAKKILEKAEDFNYSKVITCNATAYDLSFQSCGKWPGDPGYGITASGTRAKYGTVAVDPRVIPLGTRMYIESADGSFVYGYCVAEDTGGAIKGNKVDLFFDTYSECMQFGRRSVNVYILD